VPAHRNTASLLALLALIAAALPVEAAAFPSPSLKPASPLTAGWQSTAAVREQVPSAGVYELTVTVTTEPATARAAAALTSFLKVKIGPLAQRAQIDARAHRASLRVLLAINRRAFTVRVTGASFRPRLKVRLRRIGNVAAGTKTRGITLATAPTGTAGKGRTRASGTVTKVSNTNAAAATSTVPSIPSGSTGTIGSTGSSGSTPPASPPTPPAPPTPTTGPNGNPIIALPSGFTAIENYSTPVKDYEFNGPSLPADWAAGTWSHGFNATLFQPSQVTLTGSSVALTATNQPSGGYPYQSGYLSTQGSYSMNYGLIDFRAKMPAGQGLWSGLWLDQPDHSNPWGEIDVMEMLLGNTHTVWGSLHNWAPDPYWSELQGVYMADDASQGFHDYQVVWQPGMITWAVDGVAYAQYTKAQAQAAGNYWTFDDGTGFYLVADLAVGGASDWGGPPNSSTVFPASMQIQSVKVWQ
jgi:hypothetical protein